MHFGFQCAYKVETKGDQAHQVKTKQLTKVKTKPYETIQAGSETTKRYFLSFKLCDDFRSFNLNFMSEFQKVLITNL